MKVFLSGNTKEQECASLGYRGIWGEPEMKSRGVSNGKIWRGGGEMTSTHAFANSFVEIEFM